MMSKIQFELCCLLVTFMVLIHFLVTFRMVTANKANSNEGHARQWHEQENKPQTFYDLTMLLTYFY